MLCIGLVYVIFSAILGIWNTSGSK